MAIYIQPTEDEARQINLAVARWLKAQGISHREAAERLGIQEAAIGVQLHGKGRRFSPGRARRWSAALGLNEEFLLTGKGPVGDRSQRYSNMAMENDNLRTIVKSQEITLKTVRAELERYRELYGPLPVVRMEPVLAMHKRV